MFKKTLLKYLIAMAVGAVIVLMMLWGQGYFTETNWRQQCRLLCDAFTFSGLIIMLLCALVWVSNRGMFLGIGYAFGRLFHTLLPFLPKSKETYAEYRERKLERGGVHGYGFLFLTGLLYFAVAIVFLIIYYQIPTA